MRLPQLPDGAGAAESPYGRIDVQAAYRVGSSSGPETALGLS